MKAKARARRLVNVRQKISSGKMFRNNDEFIFGRDELFEYCRYVIVAEVLENLSEQRYVTQGKTI